VAGFIPAFGLGIVEYAALEGGGDADNEVYIVLTGQ
jgi:hypothetical protein